MASYFNLTLDTIGPQITLAVNTFTVQGIETDITILSNEPLSNAWQSVYIVDSQGKKYNMILSISADGTSYSGMTNFYECAAGIATVYAQLQDEVGNLSNIAAASINVLSASVYYCEADIHSVANIKLYLAVSSADMDILPYKAKTAISSGTTATKIKQGGGRIAIEKAVT